MRDLGGLALVEGREAAVEVRLVEDHGAAAADHGDGVALTRVVDGPEHDIVQAGELAGHVQVQHAAAAAEAVGVAEVGKAGLEASPGGGEVGAWGDEAGEVRGVHLRHAAGGIRAAEAAEEAGAAADGVLIDESVEAGNINADDARERPAGGAVCESDRGQRAIVGQRDDAQPGEIAVHREPAADLARMRDAQSRARLHRDRAGAKGSRPARARRACHDTLLDDRAAAVIIVRRPAIRDRDRADAPFFQTPRAGDLAFQHERIRPPGESGGIQVGAARESRRSGEDRASRVDGEQDGVRGTAHAGGDGQRAEAGLDIGDGSDGRIIENRDVVEVVHRGDRRPREIQRAAREAYWQCFHDVGRGGHPAIERTGTGAEVDRARAAKQSLINRDDIGEDRVRGGSAAVVPRERERAVAGLGEPGRVDRAGEDFHKGTTVRIPDHRLAVAAGAEDPVVRVRRVRRERAGKNQAARIARRGTGPDGDGPGAGE